MAYAFLNGLGAQTAVDCGAAHGALAMITPGDNAMTSLAEVKALAGRGGGDPLTRDDLRLLKMTPMKTSQQGITP